MVSTYRTIDIFLGFVRRVVSPFALFNSEPNTCLITSFTVASLQPLPLYSSSNLESLVIFRLSKSLTTPSLCVIPTKSKISPTVVPTNASASTFLSTSCFTKPFSTAKEGRLSRATLPLYLIMKSRSSFNCSIFVGSVSVLSSSPNSPSLSLTEIVSVPTASPTSRSVAVFVSVFLSCFYSNSS